MPEDGDSHSISVPELSRPLSARSPLEPQISEPTSHLRGSQRTLESECTPAFEPPGAGSALGKHAGGNEVQFPGAISNGNSGSFEAQMVKVDRLKRLMEWLSPGPQPE